MDHKEAVETVKAMARKDNGDVDFVYDLATEIEAAKRGNSIFGSLLSIQFKMPRQYAEPAVVEALEELLNEEEK